MNATQQLWGGMVDLLIATQRKPRMKDAWAIEFGSRLSALLIDRCMSVERLAKTIGVEGGGP